MKTRCFVYLNKEETEDATLNLQFALMKKVAKEQLVFQLQDFQTNEEIDISHFIQTRNGLNYSVDLSFKKADFKFCFKLVYWTEDVEIEMYEGN